MLIVSAIGKQILALRKKGMSFSAIAKAVSCSPGTVYYFLTPGAKERSAIRNRQRRRANSKHLKDKFGGVCAACGYDKCIEALEFDHLYPEEKEIAISSARNRSLGSVLKEATKCILLCCRCHRERHAGLLDIGAFMEPTI